MHNVLLIHINMARCYYALAFPHIKIHSYGLAKSVAAHYVVLCKSGSFLHFLLCYSNKTRRAGNKRLACSMRKKKRLLLVRVATPSAHRVPYVRSCWILRTFHRIGASLVLFVSSTSLCENTLQL